MLIVENGTGLANAESFVEVTEIDAYAAKFGLTFTGTLTEKEVAARQGTQFMEAQFGNRITGSRSNEVQALSWPRTGARDRQVDSYAPDGYGNGWSYIGSNVVPQAWKDAQCELSIKARTENLMPDVDAGSGGLTSESVEVGPIAESKSYASGGAREVKYFRKVELLIQRFLRAGNVVERA